MTTISRDWQKISALSGDSLKQSVFSIMREAALSVNSLGSDDPQLLEIVPRLADLVPSREELRSFRHAFSALARATGLWNYIDKENADSADLLLAETVTAPELGGITLHREQIAALNDLFAGKNLILSAPTSFGKSILIDALLASGHYRRIAIVLPTIALLDEFRRRLRRRFRDTFQVIMHQNDESSDAPTIFLGTQERLISRPDLGSIDLTVVDEFYKLDPARHDDRNVTLNAAVYKLLHRSKQFFFLGPNIDGVRVSAEGRWKFEFLRTRFSTVAVDTYDFRGVADKEEKLYEEIEIDSNWPALVFVSSPDKANKLASEAAKRMAISDESEMFANWLIQNVGKQWSIAGAVKYGFGVHHGRVPRAIASHMVRLFNEGCLPVLFCTSTLIEGVNTAAKTVLIYDKTINRANYDFFTFSNIKGRAGRLGQHHVGKVCLFNEPPHEEITEVSPTLFGNDDEAPDDYVVHLEEEDTSSKMDERIEQLHEKLDLDRNGLRLAATVGLEVAVALKGCVATALKRDGLLIWSGRPKYSQIQAVVSVICKVKSPRDFGVVSEKQLTFFINKLRRASTMRQFLIDFDANYEGDSVGYDNIFKFLRACEYGLPQLFSVVEMFVKALRQGADYSLFLRELSRWFRAEELKNLDEEGIPIQISERFFATGDDRKSLIRKLTAAAIHRLASLTEFERQWVAAALDIEHDVTSL